MVNESDGMYVLEANRLLKEVNATALLLVVIDGAKGNGVQVVVNKNNAMPSLFAGAMAKVLRNVADRLEKESSEIHEAGA